MFEFSLVLISSVFWLTAHNEMTRSWYGVALRESFGIPFWFFHLLFLTLIFQSYERDETRNSEEKEGIFASLSNFVFFIVSTFLFLMSWQFSQFILLTGILFTIHSR